MRGSVALDPHSNLDFANLRYEIGQARRTGWKNGDVLNARPLAGLQALL